MSQHALLLVNLGSPESTSVSDVRRYLNQFLMDPYVIDLPWAVRRLLVSLILIARPKQSAAAYQEIWWDEGSPLVVISQQLTEAVRPLWKHGPVALAMRYGASELSIEQQVQHLQQQGVNEITLAPLYPQFADSTTTTAIKAFEDSVAKLKQPLTTHIVPAFYQHPLYIQALANSVKSALEQPFDHLLLSFHGLPERHLTKLDHSGHCLSNPNCCQTASDAVLEQCYRAQCYRTAQAFAEAAGLSPEQWSVSFQSRLGRAKWVEPYTEERFAELAQQGVKKLLVMSPAFVADCIETLEELGLRGREQFVEAGGEELVLLPCLNSQADWAAALTQICEQAALAKTI